MSRMMELARELAAAVKESPEYRALKDARARVDEHEAARIMLEDYRKRQEALRRDIQEGKDTAPAVDALKKLTDVLMLNPYLRDYLMAEVGLAAALAQVQKVIGEAVGFDSSAPEGGDPQP